jgi:release factor glutamine methyltransferase
MGTGSGVIGVTLACEIPEAYVMTTDLSEDALAVARCNADMHNVSDRIEFRQSDLFGSIGEDDSFDLILSNPPYICETEWENLPPEVRADPRIAITSGVEGMDAIGVIVERAPHHLRPGGRIMFEIGYDQADKVAELTGDDRRYRSIDIFRDLNDIDRVVILACD